MTKKIAFILFFFISVSSFFSQDLVSISFQGSILSFENRQKIHGASLILKQGEKYISKSISEVNGVYLLSADVDKEKPFILFVSKNNFHEARILFDISQLVLNETNKSSLKLKEQINIDLFSSKKNEDIDAYEFYYADKYFWDQSNYILVADDAYRLNLKNRVLNLRSSSYKEDTKRNDSLKKRTLEQNKFLEFTKLINEAKFSFKEKKYKDSYDKYIKAELILNGLSDNELVSKLKIEFDIDKNKVQKLKNSEDQVFNAQLLKAQKNYSLGRKGFAKAKLILGTDPMKSRVNDPELILLSEKISNMEAYYKLKDAAYSLAKLKTKNQEAIDVFFQTQVKADLHQKIMPQSEASQLKKSIDSLLKIVNPQKSNLSTVNLVPASTQNQGTILLAPGELHTGKDSDAYGDIIKNIENQKEEPLKNVQDVKNALDYENYYRKIQNASQNEDFQKKIKDQKDSIDLISVAQIKASELHRSQVQKKITESEMAVAERNIYVENQNEAMASKISDKKDKLDSEIYNEREFAKMQLEDHNLIIQNQKDEIALRNKIEKDSEVMRIINQKKVINSIEYIAFQKDSISKSQAQIQLNNVQEKKDYVKLFMSTPNFLKNEAGVLYEKNKMTEEIFKVKNTNGFVSSVIFRRIVVDKNGYGVVYEQITNENGKNYFTRNGMVITEIIWFNESTGDNVIEK